MDDSLFVRGIERVGHLRRDGQGFLNRYRALLESVGRRGAFDQFPHKGIDAGRFLEAVNRSDIG
jgi:hypothetical protein